MSPSEEIDQYAAGWSDLMTLVRNGHSWSGGESNRFFRNNGGRFQEMSHLAGLDQAEDGRGLALVDWDQDGRLDLWYRNRNAPRLRLMLNRKEDLGGSILIKLEGTESNRDGIGAVVEILPAEPKGRMVRSVRAGDLFLSQSSKWLHFGLGGDSQYSQARVIWPGGAVEEFEGLDGPGRYRLKQGAKSAVRLSKREELEIKSEPLRVKNQDDGAARIILPARVPMPLINYRGSDAKPGSLSSGGKSRLAIFWSAECEHCKSSLKKVVTAVKDFKTSGLEVIALSVDLASNPLGDPSTSYDVMDKIGFPSRWGILDGESANRVHQFQERLFDRTPPEVVPLAILLDELGQAVAIYRGEIVVNNVIQDWQQIKRANQAMLYHLSPPLKGTWFTNPLPPQAVRKMFGPTD